MKHVQAISVEGQKENLQTDYVLKVLPVPRTARLQHELLSVSIKITYMF